MEKETKLKLTLFWTGVAISILGWGASIWYMANMLHIMDRQILSQAIAVGIMLGTMLFGFFWLVLFGTISYLTKKTHIVFKVLLIVFIAITSYGFTVHISIGSLPAFFLAFFCAVQWYLDMDRRKIRINIKDRITRIAILAFTATAIFAFSLLFFIFFPDPDILLRVIFNAIFAVIIASHVWVVYGMFLYARAIHKSIRES